MPIRMTPPPEVPTNLNRCTTQFYAERGSRSLCRLTPLQAHEL